MLQYADDIVSEKHGNNPQEDTIEQTLGMTSEAYDVDEVFEHIGDTLQKFSKLWALDTREGLFVGKYIA
jgi:hypothetical protein